MDVAAKEMMEKVEKGILEVEDIEKDAIAAFMLLTAKKEKIAFNHDDKKTNDAIVGANQVEMPLIIAKLVPLCRKRSMVAEFIHNNSNDPNTLNAIAMLIQEGMMHLLMDFERDIKEGTFQSK